jgi:hypothetical protein
MIGDVRGSPVMQCSCTSGSPVITGDHLMRCHRLICTMIHQSWCIRTVRHKKVLQLPRHENGYVH